MFRKPAFILVVLCEVWFGALALFSPTDANYFTTLIIKLIVPEAFYISLIFWSILFMGLYHFNPKSYVTAPVSIVLSLCWFVLILGVVHSFYFTITLPLLIFMFLIRILIAMMVEAERNYGK